MADRPLIIDLLMGVEETTAHRVRKFGYGDGYVQIQADGINTKTRQYNVTTIPFTLVQTNAFKLTLDNVCNGDFFLVTRAIGLPPFIANEDVRFRIADSKYSLVSFPASDRFQFSFALEEAFSG